VGRIWYLAMSRSAMNRRHWSPGLALLLLPGLGLFTGCGSTPNEPPAFPPPVMPGSGHVPAAHSPEAVVMAKPSEAVQKLP
jgi:hypothetical protein